MIKKEMPRISIHTQTCTQADDNNFIYETRITLHDRARLQHKKGP